MLLIVVVMDVRKHSPLLSWKRLCWRCLKTSDQKVFGYRRHEVNAYLWYYTIGPSDLYHVT